MNTVAPNWKSFCLLLIDVQNDFWIGRVVQNFPEFPNHTAQLLAFCRTQGIEVVHIRSAFSLDRSNWMLKYRLGDRIPCVAGTPGAAVASFAHELSGEKVIIKHTFDAFLNPELAAYLRHTKKRFVLTAGLITSTCVLLTTASAMQLGFLTAVVEDCCAVKPSRHEYILNTYPFIFDRTTVAQMPDRQE
jgi:nicotinamidase-related amidase